jgi:transposase InsO family protein
MRQMGLHGVVRGRTTMPDRGEPSPADRVNRQFLAPRPNLLAVSDFTCDRSVQYVSIRYTERLAEAGIQPSVGSVGDSYDNALAGNLRPPGAADCRQCGIARSAASASLQGR